MRAEEKYFSNRTKKAQLRQQLIKDYLHILEIASFACYIYEIFEAVLLKKNKMA